MRKAVAYISVIISAALVLFFLLYHERKTVTVEIGSASIEATVADEPLEWKRGLSGVKQIEDNQGMLFIFPEAQRRLFWMRGMHFPIDIIWIHEGTVVGVTRNLQPSSGALVSEAWSPVPVTMALEVNAALAEEFKIATGTLLTIK